MQDRRGRWGRVTSLCKRPGAGRRVGVWAKQGCQGEMSSCVGSGRVLLFSSGGDLVTWEGLGQRQGVACQVPRAWAPCRGQTGRHKPEGTDSAPCPKEGGPGTCTPGFAALWSDLFPSPGAPDPMTLTPEAPHGGGGGVGRQAGGLAGQGGRRFWELCGGSALLEWPRAGRWPLGDASCLPPSAASGGGSWAWAKAVGHAGDFPETHCPSRWLCPFCRLED